MAEPVPQPGMQQSPGEDEAQMAGDFASILAALPPVQQWSGATIESLRTAVNSRYDDANWQEDSQWTRRLINAIVAPEDGWDWRRLKTCSNRDYFSLSTHTISLLNDAFHTNAFDAATARAEVGDYDQLLHLNPAPGGSIGYPIFRLDYSSDETFELYKKYWDRFLEMQFYVTEAVDPDDVSWYWVDDRSRLDGKGPREVQKLFRELCATTLPSGSQSLWLCLAVDREAIESMLRVYGPPAKQILTAIPATLAEISFLPYVTAVDTHRVRAGGDETAAPLPGVYREYCGYFKCALREVFSLWRMEQAIEPSRIYPRNGMVWGDSVVYETAPRG